MRQKVRTALGYVLSAFGSDEVTHLTEETIALAQDEYVTLCAIRAAAENYVDRRSMRALNRLMASLERP